jgi:hypothetical protein
MSKAQKKAVKDMKPSAYRSMLMGKLGMTEKSPKKTKDLVRWNKLEKWVNLSALLTDKKELACGTKGKLQKQKGIPSVCRPKKKISEKTPKLAGQFTKKQIEKAIEIKKKGNRIDWSKL